MTHATIVARLRAMLPGWSVGLYVDGPWWGLDGDYHPPRRMIRITSPTGAVGLFDPRTRRHGVLHSFGASWQDTGMTGRGWVERYAAALVDATSPPS